MAKISIDALQLVVLAVGLYFAYDQAGKLTASIEAAKGSIEATNKNTQMTAWNAVAEQWLDMDKTFVEHPGLQKYIYSNAPLPIGDEEEKAKADAIGTHVLDFIDNALITGHYLNSSEITHLNEWEASFRIIFSSSQVVCQIIKKHPETYSTYTRDMASEKSSCLPKIARSP
jgi:hypothetical protein